MPNERRQHPPAGVMALVGARRLAALVVVALLAWIAFAVPATAQEAEPSPTAQQEPEATEEPAEDVPADEEEQPAAEATEEPADEEAETPEEDTPNAPASDGEDTPAGDGTTLTVAEELNLRAEPSLDAEVLAVMPTGAEVSVAADAETENDFLPVGFDGEEGWAYVAYLIGDTDNLATVSEDLNLRAQPNTAADVLLVMPAGAQVRVFGEAEDPESGLWSKVRYEDQTGWAAPEFLVGGATSGEDVPATTEGEERIALDDLNVRDGPSTDNAVLLVIPAGGSMTLTTDGAENGFVTVVVDGTAGWVAAEFIARPDEFAAAEPADEAAATEETAATEEAAPVDTDGSGDGALAGQTRVALADMNMRAGSSADDAVLLIIPAGATVTLTGEGAENGYVTAEYEGTAGWVLAEYLGE